jgi:hypothetical protein
MTKLRENIAIARLLFIKVFISLISISHPASGGEQRIYGSFPIFMEYSLDKENVFKN